VGLSPVDTALAKLVHGLLEAASTRWTGGIEPALARLLEALAVERITVLGYSEETERLITLCHAGLSGSAAPPDMIAAALLPRAVAALQHGGGFRYENPAAVPAEDRAGFAELGARSLLGVPVALGESARGWVVFESLGRERQFEPELEWFKAAARIVEDTLACQRRSAEEQSARARGEHELGELLRAFLGHDLRNPLSAISGLTQLIARREGLPDDVVRRVNAIETAVARTNQWIGTLLDFLESRSPAGLTLQRTVLDLRELTSRAIGERLAARSDRPITLESASALIGAWDPARINQLLAHLLANAQTSSDGSEPVSVRLEQDALGALISIRARGALLPPAAMDRLFDPFGRRDPGELRPRSLRLGLHMARQIAESHGGSVVVESPLDGATLFTVRLPSTAP
jgi:signal transduction histidine kinase